MDTSSSPRYVLMHIRGFPTTHSRTLLIPLQLENASQASAKHLLLLAHFGSKNFNMPVSHTWPLPCSWAQRWAPTGIHLVENVGAEFLAGAVYGAVNLELESPGVFPLHQQFMTAGMEWGWRQQSQNPRGSTGSGDGSHTSPLTT